jgi:hypothetical protein
VPVLLEMRYAEMILLALLTTEFFSGERMRVERPGLELTDNDLVATDE